MVTKYKKNLFIAGDFNFPTKTIGQKHIVVVRHYYPPLSKAKTPANAIKSLDNA